ncbi:hypothetical protein [Citrobacter koseri]|uniref:hypothetical protein n=1 Tax=Citrobacter koseri TaxID=545 RepID=UPI0024B6EA99|nr:hypothetical protein [Citrobacter koseri]MDI9803991.1 hypothetical protein [Citrobacter koseri]
MSNKPSSDLNKLRAAVTDMDSLSQTAFNQIAAISTLLLCWLKTPQGQANTGITAEALNCITYLAQSTRENIEQEADDVGCAYDDDSKKGGE